VKFRAVVGCASVALVLTACGSTPSNIGAAARVGDRVITNKEISAQVNEVRSNIQALPVEQVPTPPSIQMLSALAVHRIIMDDLIDEAIKDQGLKITDADVTAFEEGIFAQYGKESVLTQIMTNNGVPLSQVHEFMRTILVENTLGKTLTPDGDDAAKTEALVNYLGDLSDKFNVEISPRFGKWSKETLQPTGSDDVLSSLNPSAQEKAQTQQ
jgi:hypothetical protein